MLDWWTDYLEYGGQIDVLYSDLEKALIKFPTLNYYLNFFHKILVTLLLTEYKIL